MEHSQNVKHWTTDNKLTGTSDILLVNKIAIFFSNAVKINEMHSSSPPSKNQVAKYLVFI